MNIIVGIVVFKNNLEILSKSLDMLFKQQFTGKKEIIILDNDNGNQINDIQSIIKDNNVTFIKSNNIGFGAGHNKIFSYANNKIFDYYLAVNPDGVPHYKMLDNLIKFTKRVARAIGGLYNIFDIDCFNKNNRDPKIRSQNII